MKILARKILSLGLITEKDLEHIEEKTKGIIERATAAALADEGPPLENLVEDVYFERKENVRRVTAGNF